MTDDGMRRLMAAIVLQAVNDYQALCRYLERGQIIAEGKCSTEIYGLTGVRERKNFSFYEIEHFIADYAEVCVEMDTEMILRKLRLMKRKSASRARRKH